MNLEEIRKNLEEIRKSLIPFEKTFLIDNRTCIIWRGRHKDISFEIRAHNFKDPNCESAFGLPHTTWCTYVFLSEENYRKFKEKIPNAPWNGDMTFCQRKTSEHLELEFSQLVREKPEWMRRSEKPYYQFGDDFAHSWDTERQDIYDENYMRNHICEVIDFLIDGPA